MDTRHLAEPFPPDTINWKPQATSRDGTKALAVAYIDARDVAERLDDVVGPDRWQVDHKQVGDQTLTGIGILTENGWCWKWDMGMVAQEGGDEAKAAKGSLSDGLKRAAVLWGIGRYLYRLPKTWVAYDKDKKRITETPALPKWALPAGAVQRPPAPPATESPIATQDGSGPSPAAPNAGNGKATSTTYWSLIRQLEGRKILSHDDGKQILGECGGDFAVATAKIQEQYIQEPTS